MQRSISDPRTCGVCRSRVLACLPPILALSSSNARDPKFGFLCPMFQSSLSLRATMLHPYLSIMLRWSRVIHASVRGSIPAMSIMLFSAASIISEINGLSRS